MNDSAKSGLIFLAMAILILGLGFTIQSVMSQGLSENKQEINENEEFLKERSQISNEYRNTTLDLLANISNGINQLLESASNRSN